MDSKLGLVGTVLYLFFALGCSQKDAIVARVAGYPITLSEFQSKVSQTPQDYQWLTHSQAGQKELMNILIREKLLFVLAQKRGLARDKKVKETLAGFKRDQIRQLQEFRESILVMRLMEKLRQQEVIVSEVDVRSFYDEHSPKEIDVRHILLPTQEDAERAASRIKAGQSFSRVARQLSMDENSKSEGGRLGSIRQGDLTPEFEEKAFGLRMWQVSDIVKTSFGYHIIQKTGERSLDYVEAKENIYRVLEREKFEKWLDQKRKNLKITINNNLLQQTALFIPEDTIVSTD